MEEYSWCSKFRTLNVDGNLSRGSPRTTCSEIIRRELKETKVSKDLADGVLILAIFLYLYEGFTLNLNSVYFRGVYPFHQKTSEN